VRCPKRSSSEDKEEEAADISLSLSLSLYTSREFLTLSVNGNGFYKA
jgi:hypothetical protein